MHFRIHPPVRDSDMRVLKRLAQASHQLQDHLGRSVSCANRGSFAILQQGGSQRRCPRRCRCPTSALRAVVCAAEIPALQDQYGRSRVGMIARHSHSLTSFSRAQSSTRSFPRLAARSTFPLLQKRSRPNTASGATSTSLLRLALGNYRGISSLNKTSQPLKTTTRRVRRRNVAGSRLLSYRSKTKSRYPFESCVWSRCPTAGLCFSQTPLVAYRC
jgi:hypothetical protein